MPTLPGRLALVESPFKGRSLCEFGALDESRDADLNAGYVRALCRCVTQRGDHPFASHIFCTEFLLDSVAAERKRGIEIGLAWGAAAQLTYVGIDRGISSGMILGIENARALKRPIVWLSIAEYKDSWLPEGIERDDWWKFLQTGDVHSIFEGEV